MRFITEFESDGTRFDESPSIVAQRKEKMQNEMGKMIANSFSWQEAGFISPTQRTACIRRTLEIEAFPMNDYLSFKRNLLDYLIDKGINPKVIQDKFSILESLGKSSENGINKNTSDGQGRKND